ncbi:MAG: UDP-2,4-diacetamido-2,4,6-trideoxy-beta-L-altropyranose hydrolase [Chitinophagaceae bacterium]
MNIERKKVVFRADGSSEIGLGHVTRCCALAEMLKNNLDCYFYTRKTSKQIIDDIQKYFISVTQLTDNISYDEEAATWISNLNGNEIVVLDGYNFDTKYQSAIKSKGCKLVCVDDIFAYHFVADVVINHAPDILGEQYSVEPYTKLFLGTDYVLLKKCFLQQATLQKRKFNFNTSPILICLGGADPQNITMKILQEVKNIFPEKKIFMVAGAGYQFKDELQQLCESEKNISVFINISSQKLINLMESAHIAITSASTIALEYVCVKGNLFLIQTANNQTHLYKSLIEKHCAYPFKLLHEKYNSNVFIENQLKLIDGKSSERILKFFVDLVESSLQSC